MDGHAEKKTFICGHEGCKKQYGTKQHLVRHTKIVHFHKAVESKINCDKCDQTFTTKQNLEKHISRKHEKYFLHVCHICSKGFDKLTLLAHHLYLHTGEKLLRCTYCDKKFANQTDRCRHESKHKIFKCQDCEKVFVIWADYLEHKRKSHKSAEYQCDECKKVFKSREYIVRHMKTHPTNERDIFMCMMCPKYYTFMSNLRNHIKLVHEYKTYDCTYPGCRAQLSSQSKLNYHFLRHTSEKKNTTPSVKKERKKRQDIGTMKRSTAVKLSGVIMSLEMEKKIINNEKIIFEEGDFDNQNRNSTNIVNNISSTVGT